jgi:tripartite-type tricarboxylate transporter receptor subunit TctC
MLRRALVSVLAVVATMPVSAQSSWPVKPVRIIVPYPPGGPSEMMVRLVGEKMQAALKQPFVLENRQGAGGNIGAAEVARAAGDGYTWLVSNDALVTVNPHVYKQLGFSIDDLVPVMVGTTFSQTLVCNPATGITTVAELVAKSKAGNLSYASGGSGSPGHLAMELLRHMAGFDATHVPYKGPAPATQDILGGQVHCGLLAGPTVLPHIRAGKLVALAVSGVHRSATLPNLPTVAEAGVPGYAADFALVVFAPKGTSDAIITRFRQAFVDGLRAPDVTDKLKAVEQSVVGSTPAEVAGMLAADSKKWGEVARRIKLGLD